MEDGMWHMRPGRQQHQLDVTANKDETSSSNTPGIKQESREQLDTHCTISHHVKIVMQQLQFSSEQTNGNKM